ncbi:tRNA dihydrouridine synthase [Dysosmobacter sp.]|uniref:tRNA dihydrouridine synthase n=1 Tax=Dysosmobacter sp. TaxID=2591382 RepID=UPI002A85DD0D|nr:tRNA-dihydrouridine synthase family protein [Dysosmobacter sp.]MDY3280898.1 tRNA-dihydrouridine synthase family protein [Dysosmobacter sp.]
MRLYAAPMQGVTTHRFRALHAELFGGIDRYYTPFFSPTGEHRVTERDRRDLTPEHNDLARVVPQIMARRPEDFLWAAELLRGMGYREVNLNLGCPSGTVTGKGKGAGLLRDPAALAVFFETVYGALPDFPVSVKTRLGFREEDEFDGLLAVYNRFPIAELTIHARVREDFYKRPARLEAFARALPRVQAPVCYNGDLVTAADVTAFQDRFPAVEAVMLGRGLIADPALGRKLRGGPTASREEIAAFTRRLYEGYRADYGDDNPAAQRMKELWFFLIRLFGENEKLAKKMRRAAHPWEYEAAEAEILRDLPLLPEPRGVLG